MVFLILLSSKKSVSWKKLSDSRSGAGNIQDEPAAFCRARAKDVLWKSKNMVTGDMSKEQNNHLEELPIDKTGKNVKINK